MLQRQIDATDRQIDRLFYELYGLTEEEAEEETSPSPTVLQPSSDPWTGLFQSGLALLQSLRK